MDVFDYIVVGAGTSGCVIAHRLAAGTTASVLLVEAGGPNRDARARGADPASLMSLWARPGPVDWGHTTVPQPGLGGRRVPIAQGRALGGSGSINAALWVRGERRDYDRWAALGAEGWDYDGLLPCFVRAEDFTGPPAPVRGIGGPLPIRHLQRPTPVAQALFGAAGKLGLRAGADGFDYNAAERRENVVFGYQATLYPDGGRAGPAETYLRPALTRPNLTVLDRTLIRRVTVRAGRATGVEYVRDGRAGSVRAAREIVLCAGAFGSPHLLLLSGIGPARQLAGHAIAVVSDVPGVGAALKDHLILPVAYLSARAADPGAGLIAETGFFLRTAGQRPEEPPGLQFAFGGLKFVPPELDRTGPGFSFAAILAQPCSRGSVTLASADPARPPLVDPGYLTADSDLEALRDGAQLCRELASTPQLRPFAAQELAPGPQVRTRAELDTYIRTYAGTQWHPAGTCRMGATQDPEAVVDPRLRVRGVAGLRVADASIMPRIVAGNTNATCVAIGEKAAELIAADAERG